MQVKSDKVKVLITQSGPTLCDHMNYNLPDSSVHGILQKIILEWVVTLFSRGSSRPRDRTWVSCIAGRFFTVRATREAPSCVSTSFLLLPYSIPAFRDTTFYHRMGTGVIAASLMTPSPPSHLRGFPTFCFLCLETPAPTHMLTPPSSSP